jgi:CDP-diacylglycerol--glycerol-3-phosphate 3-phosphatidyltransferase
MNLPNKLTVGRMFAIPLIIILSLITKLDEIVITSANNYILSLQDYLILGVFLIAAFTDFLDGYLARKHNLITNFGKFMDPLADKLLVLAAMIVLLEKGRFVAFNFNLGFVITIILAREFMVTGMRLLAVDNNVVIAASKLGKLKTISQMLMIVVLILNAFPITFLGSFARDLTILIVITIAGLLTLISGIDYFEKNKELITKSK